MINVFKTYDLLNPLTCKTIKEYQTFSIKLSWPQCHISYKLWDT